jgi:hypothetical protein
MDDGAKPELMGSKPNGRGGFRTCDLSRVKRPRKSASVRRTAPPPLGLLTISRCMGAAKNSAE